MQTPRARICLIAPEFIGPFPNGGVGTACYWEATILAVAGYDVTVLYTGPTECKTAAYWEKRYLAAPFSFVDLWSWASRESADRNQAQQPCAEAATADLVHRFLRDRRFDLLLFQEFLGHGARALQARRSGDVLAGARAAVTLHSCRQWIYEGMRRLPTYREDLYVDFLERESARLADSVVAPSRHMAAWAREHWSLHPVPVVPYCYDAAVERPADVIEHRGPFSQLVFFGRLETRKGLHLLCRALAEHPSARGALQTITFLGKASTVEGRPSEEFIRATLADVPGLEIRVINDLGSLEALKFLETQKDTIVVAPSIVDNLPYAIIELFARRLPIVSTRIGGIPEIFGPANGHALAEPTPEGLARVLSGIHDSGSLTIDYRSGYSIKASNAAHLKWVEALLKTQPHAERVENPTGDVVLVDAATAQLPELRRAFIAADPTAAGSRFMTWSEWRANGGNRPAVFAGAQVTPHDGMVARLTAALEDSRVFAATSSYESKTVSGTAGIAPLGPSLETGWAANVFGGPCFAARGAALDRVRESCLQQFRFWPAYASIACAELELALVPACLFSAQPVAENVDAAEAVAGLYQKHLPKRFDLDWVLKFAGARDGSFSTQAAHAASAPAHAVHQPVPPTGRAIYDRYVTTPDAQLATLSGLTWTANQDPYVRDIHHLRAKLAAIAAEWEATDPRVYINGAGQHTRLLLSLEPRLGRFVGGFIDRRPIGDFLGKPVTHPEMLTAADADIVLYSSREYEKEMFERLSALDVKHQLLYGDAAERNAADPETTSSRVRRRLGHQDAPIEELRAMYRPPSWVRGGCSGGDVEFLLEFVTSINPRLVLELGVASGTSSAALLFALDRLPPTDGGRMLVSGDVRHTCYFDPARATGAAVHDMYPGHRTAWLLNTNTDARRVRESLPGPADFSFIDANHCHPWPLLDLLHVATMVRPGSWIALHDIELPRLHPQFQVHGPQWLFEAWPFNKVHGVDGSVNIGAVQLPDDLERIIPVALELLERQWEHTPTTWDIDLPDVFAPVSRFVQPRLATPVAEVLAG